MRKFISIIVALVVAFSFTMTHVQDVSAYTDVSTVGVSTFQEFRTAMQNEIYKHIVVKNNIIHYNSEDYYGSTGITQVGNKMIELNGHTIAMYGDHVDNQKHDFYRFININGYSLEVIGSGKIYGKFNHTGRGATHNSVIYGTGGTLTVRGATI